MRTRVLALDARSCDDDPVQATDRTCDVTRLRLRALDEADLERLTGWLADSERRPWEVVDLNTAAQDLATGLGQQDEDGEFRLWAVETLSGRHIGLVSWMADWRWPGVYEISEVLVAPHERGQGYGTETVTLAIGEVFRTRPAHKLFGTAAAANDAIARTIVRAGGRHEATLRRHLVVGDEEIDIHVFSLLRDEWASPLTGRPLEGRA